MPGRINAFAAVVKRTNLSGMRIGTHLTLPSLNSVQWSELNCIIFPLYFMTYNLQFFEVGHMALIRLDCLIRIIKGNELTKFLLCWLF